MKVSMKHRHSSFVCSKHSFIHHTPDGCSLLGAVEVIGDGSLCTVCIISHKYNEIKSNLKQCKITCVFGNRKSKPLSHCEP